VTTPPDPFHHDQLAALAAVLEKARGLEVDFAGHDLKPHQRRLLDTLGVTVKEEKK
jgi:hypothetical protein